MFYLFWLIFNLAFLVSFLYICIKTLKLVSGKFGLVATIILALGLFSYICTPRIKKDRTRIEWPSDNLADNTQIKFSQKKYIELKKNFMFRAGIDIYFLTDDTTGITTPVRAHTRLNGVQGGYQWDPETVNLIQVGDNIYEYTVSSTLTFYLLAFPLINLSQNYVGVIKLESAYAR